jgi:hypothetical protein
MLRLCGTTTLLPTWLLSLHGGGVRLARSGTFRGWYFPGACMAPGVRMLGCWMSGFGRKPFRGLPGVDRTSGLYCAGDTRVRARVGRRPVQTQGGTKAGGTHGPQETRQTRQAHKTEPKAESGHETHNEANRQAREAKQKTVGGILRRERGEARAKRSRGVNTTPPNLGQRHPAQSAEPVIWGSRRQSLSDVEVGKRERTAAG